MSVVIPIKDDPRLATCLQALEQQTYPAASFEVIVVDNGSRIDVAPVCAEYPHVRLLAEPTPGAAAARNTGVAAARGEVIAFTDADCQPAPDWLEQGVAACMAADGSLVGGRIEFSYASIRPTPVELADARFHLKQERYIRNGYAATANAFVSRQLFMELGGFDTRYMSCEDVEFGMRLTRTGRAARYASGAVVQHPARGEFGALVRKRRAQVAALHDIRPPVSWPTVLRRLLPDPVHLSNWWRETAGILPERRARLTYLLVTQTLHSLGGWDEGLIRLREARRGAAGDAGTHVDIPPTLQDHPRHR